MSLAIKSNWNSIFSLATLNWCSPDGDRPVGKDLVRRTGEGQSPASTCNSMKEKLEGHGFVISKAPSGLKLFPDSSPSGKGALYPESRRHQVVFTLVMPSVFSL